MSVVVELHFNPGLQADIFGYSRSCPKANYTTEQIVYSSDGWEYGQTTVSAFPSYSIKRFISELFYTQYNKNSTLKKEWAAQLQKYQLYQIVVHEKCLLIGNHRTFTRHTVNKIKIYKLSYISFVFYTCESDGNTSYMRILDNELHGFNNMVPDFRVLPFRYVNVCLRCLSAYIPWK